MKPLTFLHWTINIKMIPIKFFLLAWVNVPFDVYAFEHYPIIPITTA